MKIQSFPWPDDGREARESITRVRLRSVKESFEHICRHPLVTIFVWLLMGIALSLPAGFWLVQHNIDKVVKELSTDTGFTVDLRLDLPGKEVESSADELRRNPLVERVDIVTATQALEEFQLTSDFDEVLAALDSNPLPASLIVTVKKGTEREQILSLAEKLEEQTSIASVEVDTEWMVQLRQIQQIASRLTWILSALYGIGVVFVSVAAVRYAMDSRFEELRVISLLGATNRSMRRPFVYCGTLYGFGGGVVAMCIVILALMAIEPPLQELASRYGGSVGFVAMNYVLGAVLVFIGSVLGLVGALHVTFVQMQKNSYLNRAR
ncbi:MAG: hypothetical protein F4X44_07680 [Gammaproteobacteria bacterium]|nr:hypothetical protein [Gammaproteobacteria bacterium]MYD80476.1 hypothetical protein [Gammaproteobacteria bacterium]